MITFMVLFVVGLPAVIFAVLTVFGLPSAELTSGFVLGSLGTLVFKELRLASGSANMFLAADGEVRVDEILRKSVPAKWEVRSGLLFDYEDVDHVIVGDSMIVVVETKTTASMWSLTEDGVNLNKVDPTRQALKALARTRRLVAAGPSRGIDGEAWLVISGPFDAERDRLLPTFRAGVQVMTLGQLADAAKQLPEIVDTERLAVNVDRVDRFLTKRYAYIERSRTETKAA